MLYPNLFFLLITLLQMHSNSGLEKSTATSLLAMTNAVEVPSESIAKKDSVVPLTEFYDSSFITSLKARIAEKPSWQSLINGKKMAVGLVDMSNPEKPRFATINGNTMMYAASLPKIAVLLAMEDAIEHGEIKLTPDVEKDMRLMISKSNNRSTTKLIDLLGFEKIENVLTHPEYKLYDKKAGGGLWVGKRYAAGGNTNREPLKNLSHAATVEQVCRFYYLMYKGRLVSEAKSAHMMEMMVDPELSHKFVGSVTQINPKSKIYRKSGTWKNWHADSVMVMGSDKKYILVALVEDSNGEQILRDLVYSINPLLKTSLHENTQQGQNLLTKAL